MAIFSKKHGHAGQRSGTGEWLRLPSRTYMSWQSMHARTSGKHSQSRYYEGVGVDQRWKSFDAFLEDMGERPDGLSLDRIDRTKDYGPDNCKWATMSEQSKNRRSFTRSNSLRFTLDGETKTVGQWARHLNISRSVLFSRITRGWSFEKAISQPVRLVRAGIARRKRVRSPAK